MYIEAKRHNYKWSHREDAILWRLHQRGRSPERIARLLQRRPAAINLRLTRNTALSRQKALVVQKLQSPQPPRREKRRVFEKSAFDQGVRRPILLPFVSILEGTEGYTTKEI